MPKQLRKANGQFNGFVGGRKLHVPEAVVITGAIPIFNRPAVPKFSEKALKKWETKVHLTRTNKLMLTSALTIAKTGKFKFITVEAEGVDTETLTQYNKLLGKKIKTLHPNSQNKLSKTPPITVEKISKEITDSLTQLSPKAKIVSFNTVNLKDVKGTETVITVEVLEKLLSPGKR